MMLGALIGVAGSLIGGAMQNKAAKKAANQERKWAVEDQAEQFVRLRAAAEKAGFNPLTALGAAPNSGMVNPTQAAQAYMGEAIATSSLMLADSLAKTKAAATGKRLENANRANADLTRKLNAATLRPKMAGVFDRPTKFGIAGSASGKISIGANASAPKSPKPVEVRVNEGHLHDGKMGDVAVPNPTMDGGPGVYIGGVYLEAPPGWSTPAYSENNMLGDNPVNWGYGIGYVAAMAGHNLGRFGKYAYANYANSKAIRDSLVIHNKAKPQGFRAQHLGAR